MEILPCLATAARANRLRCESLMCRVIPADQAIEKRNKQEQCEQAIHKYPLYSQTYRDPMQR